MAEEYVLPEAFDGSKCWSTAELRTRMADILQKVEGVPPEHMSIVMEAVECFAYNEGFVIDEPLVTEMTNVLDANLAVLKEAREKLSEGKFIEMIILGLSRSIDRHKPRMLRDLKHKELGEKLSEIEGMAKEAVNKTLNGIVMLENNFGIPVTAEDIQHYIDHFLPQLPERIAAMGLHSATRETYAEFFAYMTVQKPEAARHQQVSYPSMN